MPRAIAAVAARREPLRSQRLRGVPASEPRQKKGIVAFLLLLVRHLLLLAMHLLLVASWYYQKAFCMISAASLEITQKLLGKLLGAPGLQKGADQVKTAFMTPAL